MHSPTLYMTFFALLIMLFIFSHELKHLHLQPEIKYFRDIILTLEL